MSTLHFFTVSGIGMLNKAGAEAQYKWMDAPQRAKYVEAALKGVDANLARWQNFLRDHQGDYMMFIKAIHQEELFKTFGAALGIDWDRHPIYKVGPIKNHLYMSNPRRLTLYVVPIPEGGVFK